jgi:hypothetical protein
VRYAHAFAALVIANLLRRVCRPATWSAVLRMATKQPSAGRDRVDDIPEAIDRASQWFPTRVLCVQRSLAIALLCRMRGCAAMVVLGARPRPFAAHAWVELNDTLVGEEPGKTRFYHVFERLG